MPVKTGNDDLNSIKKIMGKDIAALVVAQLAREDNIVVTPGIAVGDNDIHSSAQHYFTFIIQKEGRCLLTIGADEIGINGAVLFCIAPGETSYHFSYPAEVSGWMIRIGAKYMAPYLRETFSMEFFSIIPVSATGSRTTRLYDKLKLLCSIIKDRDCDTLQDTDTAMSLAGTCIEQLAKIYLAQASGPEAEEHYARITRYFYALLRDNHCSWRLPLPYAASLQMSCSYLNECVLHTTGMPVSYWIQHETIRQAKEALLQSGVNIQEVAVRLGFDSHAYFSRTFFQVTGMSPSRFREIHRQLAKP